MARSLLIAACIAIFIQSPMYSQTAAPSPMVSDAELKFVVYFSRHGVRSPTGKPGQYEKYSSAPWPVWNVPPGNLTEHGYHLMELFGAYDRIVLAHQGLLSTTGCSDASKITIYADSDQRTRETGNALAKGLFPGCDVPVSSKPEGTNDSLFHLSPAAIAHADTGLAAAAVQGRMGGSPDNLTVAYHPQLAAFDSILQTCGKTDSTQTKRTSLFDIPATLSAGQGDHLVELHGPLNTASTLAENLLLEYTEGMDRSNVGWGCVDGSSIRTLINLHTAATDFAQRTPAIASMQASKLLEQIHQALQQAVEQHPIAGAPNKSTDRALFLVGHDTNLLNMAGALNLNWIADGRRDDTAPGSTLIFELWRRHSLSGPGSYVVKIYFSVQTLEQMRSSESLTLDSPPQRVPVFILGCSNADFSCTWPSFSQVLRRASVPIQSKKAETHR